MLIALVHVHVKPGHLDAFREATIANARASLGEPGIARFDLCAHADDPHRFTLIEVYRNADAPALHKQTVHYAAWRDTVEPMMAVPRTSVKLLNLFPSDAGW